MKLMVKWQGPYDIVRRASATEYAVRLLGDPVERAKPVHWSRFKRFAGPDFNRTVELVSGAQHDQQKWYVDGLLDWKVQNDGAVLLLVQWRGYEQT